MNELHRITSAIKYLKKNDFIEKQQDLVNKLGYNKTYISGILNGKIELSSKFIETFCSCFPIINTEWLLTGEGEMLRTTQNIGDISNSTVVGANVNGNGINISHNNFSEMIEGYKDAIKKRDEQIDRLINIIEKLSEKQE
jgi:hypothetical protein